MPVNFKYSILCLVSAFLLGNSVVFAQEIDFIPVGGISASYELKISSSDSIFDGTKKKSLLSSLLKRRNLAEDDIDGSVSYQTSYHIFKVQYGLYDNLNAGIKLPYLSKKRDSSLTVSDSADTDQNRFKEDYKTAETQGIGDFTLFMDWRPVYSDVSDFRLGISFDGNNAPYYLNNSDNVSLGNGANDLGMYIRWIIYSTSSNLIVDTKLGTVYTFDSTITEDSETYDLKKGNSGNFSLDLSLTNQAWNYGGGLEVVADGERDINGEGQADGYLAYSYSLFVNFGNLNLLENSTVGLPWLVGASFKNVIGGANAPAETTISLKAVFYF